MRSVSIGYLVNAPRTEWLSNEISANVLLHKLNRGDFCRSPLQCSVLYIHWAAGLTGSYWGEDLDKGVSETEDLPEGEPYYTHNVFFIPAAGSATKQTLKTHKWNLCCVWRECKSVCVRERERERCNLKRLDQCMRQIAHTSRAGVRIMVPKVWRRERKFNHVGTTDDTYSDLLYLFPIEENEANRWVEL